MRKAPGWRLALLLISPLAFLGMGVAVRTEPIATASAALFFAAALIASIAGSVIIGRSLDRSPAVKVASAVLLFIGFLAFYGACMIEGCNYLNLAPLQ